MQENIPDSVINLVQPYINNEEFQPASIAKVSKACTSICQWVRAMHKYHFVAKGVEPKRVKTEIHIGAICYPHKTLLYLCLSDKSHLTIKNVLIFAQQAIKEAQEDLAVTQCIWDDAKEKLAVVEDGVATLQAKYQDCLSKKDELDNKYQLCEARLVPADKVRRREKTG